MASRSVVASPAIISFLHLLEQRARESPAKVAYTFWTPEALDGGLAAADLQGDSDSRLTYEELYERARQVAVQLQAAGASQERVLLLFPPGLEFVVGFLGCLLAGAVAVPAYPPQSRRALPRLGAIAEDAQPVVALTSEQHLEKFSRLASGLAELAAVQWLTVEGSRSEDANSWRPPGNASDGIAFLQYTSGSTSLPKGVQVTFESLAANEELIRQAFAQTAEEVVVSWLPLYHDMGLIGAVLQPLFVGATAHLMAPLTFLQEPKRWLSLISRTRATTSGGPNFSFQLCVDRISPAEREALDLSSWRVAFNGAEPVRATTLDLFAETFAPQGFRREAFLPCYGLAEATLFVSGVDSQKAPRVDRFDAAALEQDRAEVASDDSSATRSLVSCGQAPAGARVEVVDPETHVPALPGTVGEIWVAGESLARGYWNRPQESTESFGARLSGDSTSETFLRTGDLGFVDSGELFVTGRLKDLVILRGRNHYPQDIELTAESSHAAFRPGCTAAFAVEVEGEERLAVVQEVRRDYRDPDSSPLVEAIRKAVAEVHEVEIWAVELVRPGGVPKTSSGKIQRRACRAAFLEGSLPSLLRSTAGEALSTTEAATFVAPRTDLEERIAEQWSLVLGGRPVGVEDHFIALGGDSILAAQLVSRLRASLELDLPVELVFEAPTVAQQAERIEGLTGTASLVTPVPRQGEMPIQMPVTFAQERLWLLEQMDPGSAAFQVSASLRLGGPLASRPLEQSLTLLVARHEALRTTLPKVDGGPCQMILPPAPFPLPVVDLSHLEPEQRAAVAEKLSEEDVGTPFDLAAGPLFRATLAHLGPQEHVLLLNTHHAISDGWSMGILVRELVTVYGELVQGRQPELPALPLQLADFAVWQRQRLQGEFLEEQVSYWKEQLSGAPMVLELPTDGPRPAVQTFRGGRQQLALPKALAASLKEVGRRDGATLFMTLLAALALILRRHTGQQDLLVGTPASVRPHADLEQAFGFFLNTLVLRADLSEKPTFRQLMSRLRDTALGAFGHQEMPYKKVVEELQVPRDLSRTPLFQVFFNLLNFPFKKAQVEGLDIELFSKPQPPAKFDMTVYVEDLEDGLHFDLVYNADLFSERRMEIFLAQYGRLLEQVAEAPELSIDRFSLVTPEERAVLPDPSRPLSAEWHGFITEKLTESARRSPESLALADPSGQWSYREYEAWTNRLAHVLRGAGIGEGDLVAIHAERNGSLPWAVMGIWKAGAAFMVIDPAYPPRAVLERVEMARPQGWLRLPGCGSMPEEVAAWAAENPFRLQLDLPAIGEAASQARLAAAPVEPPAISPDPNGLAYIAFTSGTTGRSKGIVGSFLPQSHFFVWYGENFQVTSEDRFSLLSGLAHDPLLRDIFGPIWFGGSLHVPPPEIHKDAKRLGDWVRDGNLSVLNCTPSLLRVVASEALIDEAGRPTDDLGLPSVRYVFTVGELLTWRDVRLLEKTSPEATLVNFYGATETPQGQSYFLAMDAQRGRIQGQPGLGGGVPLGRGIDGVQLVVQGPQGEQAGVGEVGEVCVRTPYLSLGYLEDAAATAEDGSSEAGSSASIGQTRTDPAFTADPAGKEGVGLYFTGDLGSYLPDGTVAFLSRIDDQLKIRGFRIEPAHVEAAVLEHPAIEQAAVFAADSATGAYLAACLVRAHGFEMPSAGDLQTFLKDRLPESFVPSRFAAIDEMPLTLNGKADRRKLKAHFDSYLESQGLAPAADFAAPAGAVEERIAEIWRELLEVERVGAHDNFFELGGHSLLATRLAAQLEREFGTEVRLKDLFLLPTVAELAAHVSPTSTAGEDRGGVTGPEERGSKAEVLELITPATESRFEPFPLTEIQQAYWIGRSAGIELGNVASHRYLEMDSENLDLPRLEVAWQSLVDRHDMLRAVVHDDGQQQVLEEVPAYRIEVEDLRGLPVEEMEASLLATRQRLSHNVMPSDRFPLFEIRASRLGEGRYRLHFSFDLLIADAWSFGVIGRDLAEAYRVGRPAAAPELSFRDYVLAEKAIRQSALYRRSEAYWQERLATLPPAPELPLVKALSALQEPRFVRRTSRVEAADWQRLRELATRAGVTSSGLLLTAFSQVLATWSKNPNFLIVLTLFNRLPLHQDVGELVGDFTTTNLLEVNLDPQETFRKRAKGVQQRLFEDLDHRYMSGVEVLRELGRKQGGGIRAAAPVVFTSLLDLGRGDLLEVVRELDAEIGYSVSQTPQVYLDHQVYEEDGALVFNWDVVEEILPPGLLDEMFDAYCSLLQDLLKDESSWQRTSLSSVPADQLEVRSAVNATEDPVPAGLLQEPFFAQASRNPEAVAVVAPGRSVSYGELAAGAARLGQQLRDRGAQPNELVAIVMEKGWEQVAAAFGVLVSGAAYLPVDPALPAQRQAFLLEFGKVRFVLTQSWLEDSLEWPAGVERLVVDDATVSVPEGAALPELAPSQQQASDLAYVIFTSGSTGLPKGVMIDHRGALNTCVDINQRFQVGPEDRTLALSALNFDLSVYDLFGLLGAGGAIVMPEASGRREPGHWWQLIADHGVTIWNTVPALMEMLVEHAEDQVADRLRLVLLSGDWIPLSLPERIEKRAPGASVISLGGATEASIWSILYPIDTVEPSWASVPYGKPMVNQTFHVLDEGLDPRPVWVPGELYIGGIGVALGYWRDEEKTSGSFLTHPRTGERLYRTGDLGRYLPDGNIEFLGREDFQVKVQGYRIELGEIEAALLEIPGVRSAVASVAGERWGSRRLVGYLVTGEEPLPERDEIRRFLLERLPEYMVPLAFVELEALPLSANGKVDRGALPEPDWGQMGEDVGGDDGAPIGPVEELVAGIWCQVLDLPQVGRNQDFFALGGHSLLATQVITRLREVLKVDLPLQVLFEAPTVAALTAAVGAAGGAGDAPEMGPIERLPRDQPLRLSAAQQRLWFLDQLVPGSPTLNVPAAIRLEGNLDPEALVRSLGRIVERQESLRTVFRAEDGQPYQRVQERFELALPRVDLAGLRGEDREGEMVSLATREAWASFDLAQDDLFRVHLLKLAEGEHVLLLTFHHIAADGWSMGVFARELAAIYTPLVAETGLAAVNGSPETGSSGTGLSGTDFSKTSAAAHRPLPELRAQYADFAAWQLDWFESGILEPQLDYWKQRLESAPQVLELPLDRPRPAVLSVRGKRFGVTWSQELTESLRALSRDHGGTLFMTLLAAYQTLLHGYSQQREIVVGSPIAGRRRPEAEDLIGMFFNLLAFRTDLGGDPSFGELLGRSRETALGAYANQDLPFEKLLEELAPDRDTSRTPIFQVTLVLADAPMGGTSLPGVDLSLVDIDRQVANFDLNLQLSETADGLQGWFEYRTELLDGSTISRMAHHFQTLLAAAAEDPTRRLSELSLLSAPECQQLVTEWNDTARPFDRHETLHSLFEAQVARTPDAPAVAFGGRQWSYREVEEQANQIAHHLRSIGVRRGDLVAVLLERSAEMVPTVLGVLKAGGAYVPLETSYPASRISWIVKANGINALLFSESALDLVFELEDTSNLDHLVCIDGDPDLQETPARHHWTRQHLEAQPSVSLEHLTGGEDMAYIIFTSGSTGRPKGVMVRHEPVINLIEWVNRTYQVGPGDRVLFITSLCFDLSVYDVFGLLAAGGTVRVANRDEAGDPEALARILFTEPITYWDSAPAALQQLAPLLPQLETSLGAAAQTGKEALRLVFLSGDWVPLGLPDQVRGSFPKAQVIALGGATEATVWSNFFPVTEVDRHWRSIPYGRPIQNSSYYVLDSSLRPCPLGVPGDLFIGGECLSMGYAARPDLTVAQFLPDPISALVGARMYRTGDRARFRPSGDIEFLGRLDHQIKLRGFRIELGEVEAALRRHEAVAESLAMVREDSPGARRLVAYAIREPGYRPPEEAPAEDQVEQWKDVYDGIYSQGAGRHDATFDISGWNSSYSGEAIPAEDMRTWVETTVERVLELKPRRVLEVGCGTGLLLYRLAPHCEAYKGTDLSAVSLQRIRDQIEAGDDRLDHVELEERPGHDWSGIEPGSFDLVLLNSVTQHFPDADYLFKVIEGAVGALAPGGVMFVGDVRSLPLLEAFHSSIQVFQAESGASRDDVETRIRRRLLMEEELVISPAFFRSLQDRLPALSRVEIQLKRGRYHNELSRFRFDAVLHVGGDTQPKVPTWLDWAEEGLTAEGLAERLGSQPELIAVRGIPNARLAGERAALSWLAGEGDPSVEILREGIEFGDSKPGNSHRDIAQETRSGLEPETLYELAKSQGYGVEIGEGSQAGFFYALFHQPATAVDSSFEGDRLEGGEASLPETAALTSDPQRAAAYRELVPRLREHLAKELPEYMVPAAIVLLESLPVTANGKVDRRALPEPETGRQASGESFEGPRNEVEEVLARVLAEVLGHDRVSIHDNFFELGVDSILSIQVITRAQQVGMEVTPAQLFQHQSIADLAGVVSMADPAASGDSGGVSALSDEERDQRQQWLDGCREAVGGGRAPVTLARASVPTEAPFPSPALSLTAEETSSFLGAANEAYRTEPIDLLATALGAAWVGNSGSTAVAVAVTTGEGSLFPLVLEPTVFQGWADPAARGEALKVFKEKIREVPRREVPFETDVEWPEIRLQLNLPLGLQVDLGGDPGSLVSTGEQPPVERLQMEGVPQLSVTVESDRLVVSDPTVETAPGQRLGGEVLTELRRLLEHCLSAEAGGFTASDFPEADLGGEDLDALLDLIG
ncbi:MAG: amino acid adenylation domain-containing protein [Deltaproteobacteria bacterium]|nr:amino acid adenylation domain-containing protein [Deltaproteobacteria bacterium]